MSKANREIIKSDWIFFIKRGALNSDRAALKDNESLNEADGEPLMGDGERKITTEER